MRPSARAVFARPRCGLHPPAGGAEKPCQSNPGSEQKTQPLLVSTNDASLPIWSSDFVVLDVMCCKRFPCTHANWTTFFHACMTVLACHREFQGYAMNPQASFDVWNHCTVLHKCLEQPVGQTMFRERWWWWWWWWCRNRSIYWTIELKLRFARALCPLVLFCRTRDSPMSCWLLG